MQAASEFFERLGFPSIWWNERLYPDELREAQENDLASEPLHKPCGAEHYRYAAFCHYLRIPATDLDTLIKLLRAAIADPDHVMAQAAIIDLVAHPNCSEELFSEAQRAFGDFSVQHFHSEMLTRAFAEKLKSWEQ